MPTCIGAFVHLIKGDKERFIVTGGKALKFFRSLVIFSIFGHLSKYYTMNQKQQKNRSLRIYFAGSIRGGRNDAELYQQIIDYLKNFGKVLTEHIGDPKLTHLGDDGPTDRYIHDRDMKWLLAADVLVAEVTTVSMGVGYEIGRAVEAGKKVLCLFRPDSGRNLSAMITGCPDLELKNYKDMAEAKKIISAFFM